MGLMKCLSIIYPLLHLTVTNRKLLMRTVETKYLPVGLFVKVLLFSAPLLYMKTSHLKRWKKLE